MVVVATGTADQEVPVPHFASLAQTAGWSAFNHGVGKLVRMPGSAPALTTGAGKRTKQIPRSGSASKLTAAGFSQCTGNAN